MEAVSPFGPLTVCKPRKLDQFMLEFRVLSGAALVAIVPGAAKLLVPVIVLWTPFTFVVTALPVIS